MKTKKLKNTAAILLIFLLFSCKKDNHDPLSENIIEYEGWISKEIVVEDNKGVNSAYYRVYGRTENDLEMFLLNYKLSIAPGIESHLLPKAGISPVAQLKPDDEDLHYYNLNDEPSIIVSLLASNLEVGNNGFILKVEQADLKSTSTWIHGAIVGYETTNSFIGLVHWEGLYPVLVHHRWLNCWLCSWQHNVDSEGSVLTYWVGKYFNQYWYKYDWNSHYKRGLTVRHHLHQPQQAFPYFIAYENNEFRGNECEIGTWDSRNCYVGAPPTGSTAFMWPDNKGSFYYTPVAGSNPCPLPGSWFDQHNCQYTNIPGDKTYGFIFQNKWYVKGNKILSY